MWPFWSRVSLGVGSEVSEARASDAHLLSPFLLPLDPGVELSPTTAAPRLPVSHRVSHHDNNEPLDCKQTPVKYFPLGELP